MTKLELQIFKIERLHNVILKSCNPINPNTDNILKSINPINPNPDN